MRARIRTAEFRLEFDGDPSVWNDFVRPVLGGPEAAPAAGSSARATAAAGPAAARPAAAARPQQPASVTVEPHPDARELYRRLSDAGGRRSEKDAVVAAVWFLAGSAGDATADEVQEHFREYGVFEGARVRPALLKHVSRTHLLENAERRGAVKLTRKGLDYVRTRLVGAD